MYWKSFAITGMWIGAAGALWVLFNSLHLHVAIAGGMFLYTWVAVVTVVIALEAPK